MMPTSALQVMEHLGLGNPSGVYVALLENLYSAATRDAHVVLCGEHGVRFREYAEFIHLTGCRAQYEFIPCDCGALTTALFETELFEQSSGQCTDRRVRPAGLVQSARGGTLFLSDLHKLPGPAYVKLSSLIHDQEYRRIGNQHVATADIRIVGGVVLNGGGAAARSEERECIEQLAQSANGVDVIDAWIPPLRERRTDVPVLLEFFYRKFGPPAFKGKDIGFDAAALQWLSEYPWPGNDRQLEDLVQRLAALATVRRVSVEMVRGMLPAAPGRTAPRSVVTSSAQPAVPCDAESEGQHNSPDANVCNDDGESSGENSSDSAPCPATNSPPFIGNSTSGIGKWSTIRSAVILALALLLAGALGYMLRWWTSTLNRRPATARETREIDEPPEEPSPARQTVETSVTERPVAPVTAEQIEEIETVIDDGRFDKASDLIGALSDSAGSRSAGPIISSLASRLQRRVSQEEERRLRFSRIVEQLVQLAPEANETALSAARRLARTEEEWRELEMIEEQIAEHGVLLDAVTTAIGDTDAYESALRNYMTHYPTSRRAQDFEKVLSTAVSDLEVVEQWNALIDSHPAETVHTLDPHAAREVRVRASGTLETCDGLPGSEYVREFLLPHLAARAARDRESQDSLRRLLNERWLRAPFVYEWSDGSRYYLSAEPPTTPERVTCSYFSDLQSTEKQITLSTSGFAERLAGRSESIHLLDSVVDELDGLEPGKWEPVFIAIISDVQSDDGLGFTPRVYLLREILRVACRGSVVFQIGFGRYLEILEEVDFGPDGDGLDPLTEKTTAVRTESEYALRRVDEILQQCVVATWEAGLDDSPNPLARLQWRGWLRRERGAWTCEMRDRSPGGAGALFLVQRESPDQPMHLLGIGRVDEIQQPRAGYEGAPVFVVDNQ